MVKRNLQLETILSRTQSCLLFGARGVGKTHLIRSCEAHWQPLLWFDLLDYELYRTLISDPSLFVRQVEGALIEGEVLTVIVDEVQKLPFLLDYAHQLIEKFKGQVRFILTGSSARKLKHGGGNLLAGRAYSLRLHPFTHLEIDFNPEHHLGFGTIPAVLDPAVKPELTLKAYVQTYLREEILQEALVRKVEGFSRFLDIAAQYHGKIPNMSRIARAAGISEKTVAAYFQILEDTLMCWRLPGWSESPTKQLRISPKLYLFDNGVANALKGELALTPRKGTSRYGDLFEAWVVQEAFRAIDYNNLELKLSYWQTNTDQEVDLIVSRGLGEPLLAVEIKSDTAPRFIDLKGLKSFAADYPTTKLQCWCQTRTRYLDNGVEFIPWREGLAGIKMI